MPEIYRISADYAGDRVDGRVKPGHDGIENGDYRPQA